MTEAHAKPLIASWLEPIALLGASRRASKLSEAARARMKPWVEAAQARCKVARELRDLQTQSVALGLLKEAAFFALCALEAEESVAESGASSPKEAWQRFAARAEPPPGAPEQLAQVRAAFSADDDALSLDQIAPREANELRLAAESTVAWLLRLVEIRKPAQLARARLVRCALAAVGLIVVVWGLVAYWLSLSALEPLR
jgi:hypothetical protein